MATTLLLILCRGTRAAADRVSLPAVAPTGSMRSARNGVTAKAVVLVGDARCEPAAAELPDGRN
jgi:hypothetical protein